MQEQTRELSQSVAEEPIPSVAENAAVEVDATLRERLVYATSTGCYCLTGNPES
jgi:hypothetical protein